MNNVSFSSVYFIYIFLITQLYGIHIEFYANQNYSGLLFQSTSSLRCNNFPSGQQYVGSIKTDTCLVVYKDENCKSEWSWKKNPDDRMIWSSYVGSFHICNEDDGGSTLNVDITTYTELNSVNNSTVLESYRNLCSCQNVPSFVQHMDKWSIDNHANDHLVFYEPGCTEMKWKAEKIRAGFSYMSKNMHKFSKTDCITGDIYKIQSFAPVPGFTTKCGIMENELFELSNTTGIQNLEFLEERPTIRRNHPRIQFFKETNLQDFLFDSHSTASCSNLPRPNDPKFVTNEILSIKTDICIMVYSDYNCKGRSFILEPSGSNNLTEDWESTVTGPQTLASVYNINPNWKWYTKSFNICNEGRSRLDVDITEYQGENEISTLNVLERYRDLCTCQNIPSHIRAKEKWSINTFSNSMVAYFEHDCLSNGTNSLWIPAGRSSFTIGIGSFEQADKITGKVRKIRSIGPDPNVVYFKNNCVKMFSTIIQFEIDEPTDSNYEERNVTMLASKTIFRNDGPSQLTQTYSASKSVRELVQIDIGKSFSKMDSVHVDNSVDIETRKHKGSSESKSTGTNAGWSKSNSNSASTNQGFENRESKSQSTHKSSESRNTASVGTSVQTTVGSEVGASAFGFSAKASVSTSVGVTAGFEHSSSNTQGSSTGSESVKSVSGSSTNSQDVSSGSSRGTTQGQDKSANYFEEDGFKQSLRKAYDKSGTLSSSISNSTTIENTRSFSVTQTISVPPCTEQVVHASVKMVTNKNVEYKAIAKITGQLGNRQMMAFEVHQFMDKGLKYIGDFNEYTVLAYSSGIFTAEYGVSSVIDAKGSIIETCQEQLHGCPVCQTCTNNFVDPTANVEE